VAGVDTIRGIAFQQACALGDAVDLLADPEAVLLRVEGAEDIVDYEIIAADGRRLRVCQAKTRREPRTWGAGEIAAVLNAWGELTETEDAEFAFVTDGQLGETAVAIKDVIEASRTGASQAELDTMVEQISRSRISLPPSSLLQRVELLTRFGTVGSILEGVEIRVLRLMERGRVATTEDARTAVDRLFRLLFEVGGEGQLQRREVTRLQVLDALGLTDEEVRAGGAWDIEARDLYRARIRDVQVEPDVVLLDVLPVHAAPRVLQLSGPTPAEGSRSRPAGALLDAGQVVLVSPTGGGKTTTLSAVWRIAADRGDVPVLLGADGHLPGTLGRRLHEAVARVLGRRLTAGAVERLLADRELVLLVDGVSEVDADTRDALRRDLHTLAAQRPLRVVTAGRDLAAARSILPESDNAAGFSLVGLSRGERRQIADARLGRDAANEVVRIEETLGDAVDNPLLFGMALAVSEQGGPILSRPQVYQEFLTGLAARADVVDLDITLASLGVAWSALLATSRRATDSYEWRQVVADGLDRLGGLGAFAGHEVTAGKALDQARAMGLLVRPDLDAGLVPLHDSFADYLAGAAAAHGWTDMPAPLIPAQDEQVLFAAQIRGLDHALAHRIALENPLLACRVAAQPGVERQSANPERVSVLLAALKANADLGTLADRAGARLLNDPSVLGLVLVNGPSGLVDLPEFQRLAAANPSWLLPPGTGSLAAAVNVWASAVRAELLPPPHRFPRLVPEDPDAVVSALSDHEQRCADLVQELVQRALPASTVGDRVLEALDSGIVAVVGNARPAPFGRPEFPVAYRRGGGQVLVVRDGDPRIDPTQLSAHAPAEDLLRRDVGMESAEHILDSLKALTARTWPIP
jgi:hypothetical protein